MKQNKLTYFVLILLISQNSFGQKRLDNLRSNSNFEWVVDSLQTNLTIYYEKNSYAEKYSGYLNNKINQNIKNTLNFIRVDTYNNHIHYFVLENRDKMKILTGYEYNGLANHKENLVFAILSEKTNSVYGNHELFHVIASNLWGYPESWINEGMAVYSDNEWYGYDLHQLSKYLVDNDKYISIVRMAKRLKKYDSMITYPILGSFAKFIDETYGRETIKIIWTKGQKKIKKSLGKSLVDLENEWLEMLKAIKYEKIIYLN